MAQSESYQFDGNFLICFNVSAYKRDQKSSQKDDEYRGICHRRLLGPACAGVGTFLLLLVPCLPVLDSI